MKRIGEPAPGTQGDLSSAQAHFRTLQTPLTFRAELHPSRWGVGLHKLYL
jgi:hypothetical protein